VDTTQDLPPDAPRDWRGVYITAGKFVLYAQRHNEGAFAEGIVRRTDDPDNRDRVRIEIIRRSSPNASYTRVQREIWVHVTRLTVFDRLPASPYPFEDDLVGIGERIAAERRNAMRGRPAA
jgi:hypothetical protein